MNRVAIVLIVSVLSVLGFAEQSQLPQSPMKAPLVEEDVIVFEEESDFEEEQEEDVEGFEEG